MALNIELLRQAVAWAEEEAAKENGSWNQDSWAQGEVGKQKLKDEDGDEWLRVKVSCGSSYCVAGNICAMQGDRFVVESDKYWNGDPYYEPGDVVDVDYVIPKGSKERIEIQQRALDLLGVSSVIYQEGNGDEYDWDTYRDLFDGYNTIEDVREIAEELARRHGMEL